jgi:thiol-disulfide isomerase/thioredoxin
MKIGNGVFVRWLVLALIVAVTALAITYTPPVKRASVPPITGEIQHFTLARNPRGLADFAFIDGAGRRVTLKDLRGKVVVLNFWATWCAPCIREMPSLDRLAARLKGPGFALVALNEDREGAAKVAPFLARLGLKNLPLYVDARGAVQRALGVGSLPTTILIDGRGQEVGRLVGPAEWDSPEAVALVRFFIAR